MTRARSRWVGMVGGVALLTANVQAPAQVGVRGDGTAVASATVDGGAGDVGDERAALHARFEGKWNYAGGDRERMGLDAAIERGVHTLVPFVRGFARSKLEEKTKIAAYCAFAFAGGNIRAEVPGLPPMVSPESGGSVRFDAGDGVVALSQRFEGERLVQRFVSAEGSRVNAFDRSRDGKSFTMSVTVASPKLSAPVSYTLTYTR